MGKLRTVIVILMILLFLAGLCVLLYPSLYGAFVDHQIQQTAGDFLDRQHTRPTRPVPSDPTDNSVPEGTEQTPSRRIYPLLWADMVAYNEQIFINGQEGLSCEYAYEKPSFDLTEYGLPDEIFGVIRIPELSLEMPVYLGATNTHMAAGAAHLSQTSLPIGGMNTNTIIAGHRGYGGASYFRYVNELQTGDRIYLTNIWETLTYEVVELKIIMPNEVKEIHIQEGRELLTLLTCHPYASGGKQRLLVICERIYDTEE